MWWGPVVGTCDGDVWWGLVVGACGGGVWWEHVRVILTHRGTVLLASSTPLHWRLVESI